jgi:hypothetical protein
LPSNIELTRAQSAKAISVPQNQAKASDKASASRSTTCYDDAADIL